MSIEKKLLGTNASGDAPNVEDVFSTYLYTGTDSSQTITNGIDLDGEGGMVWIKRRGPEAYTHRVFSPDLGSTAGGVYYHLDTTSTSGKDDTTNQLTSFNSDGFSIGNNGHVSAGGRTFASWTFRKAPRFFDVVTYTGDGTQNDLTINHSLDCLPGMVIIKRTDSTGDWIVFHKGSGSASSVWGTTSNSYYKLNTTDAGLSYSGSTGAQGGYASSTSFWFRDNTNRTTVNINNATYVAYLFAHDPDGENDDGMIACGSYTGNGSTTGPVIDLGWEPQYILIKKSSAAKDWLIVDSMRGLPVGSNDLYLKANTSDSESDMGMVDLMADGFKITNTWSGVNTSSATYIYMAIRAPMMKEPEAGTEVFNLAGGNTSGTLISAGFPTDFMISKGEGSGSWPIASTRLTNGDGKTYLRTDSTAAEAVTGGTAKHFEHDLGNYFRQDWGNNPSITYMFKRAKGFFDVVAYTGEGGVQNVNNSLGVPSEMIWTKRRDSAGWYWLVYHASLGPTKWLRLDDVDSVASSTAAWNNTAPTDSIFTLGGDGSGNANNGQYIAYLFATLAGISKVGGYTGNGSNQNIACGFSGGARFVLIKRTDSTGDWFFWDTERGIVTGNDPHLSLNTTSAEVTSNDSIDPESAGFTVNQVSATNINVSSATYIFMAIA